MDLVAGALAKEVSLSPCLKPAIGVSVAVTNVPIENKFPIRASGNPQTFLSELHILESLSGQKAR